MAKKKIIVIGDIILDKYSFGTVKRICPEAPVPIVNLLHSRFFLGGAANVANNIKALGHDPFLFGFAGKDKYRKILEEMLLREGINYNLEDTFTTTIKRRIFADNRLLLRIDYDDFISNDTAKFEFPTDADMIIISDYGKSVMSNKIIQDINAHALEHNIPIIIDPDIKNINKYPNADYLKLSGGEWAITNHNEILNKFGTVITTIGEGGCIIHDAIEKEGRLIPTTEIVKAIDIAGAGDTFVAALAVALAKGWNIDEACKIANDCAANVIQRIGINVPDYTL